MEYLPTSDFFVVPLALELYVHSGDFNTKFFFSGKNSEKIVIVICTLEIVIVFLEKNI